MRYLVVVSDVLAYVATIFISLTAIAFCVEYLSKATKEPAKRMKRLVEQKFRRTQAA